MRTLKRSLRRRGIFLVMAGICLIPLLGILALTLDGGRVLLERQNAQAVADASALAASYSLQIKWPLNAGVDAGGSASRAASAIASDNGYTSPAPIVNIPPTSGSFSGQSGYAQVTILRNVDRGFSSIWPQSSTTIPIYARAVARVSNMPYSTASLLVLDANKSGALTVAGSGRIVSNAAVEINSSSTSAVNTNNTGYVSAPGISMVGNYVSSSGGYLQGAITTSAAAVVDPLKIPSSGIDPFPPPVSSSLPAQSYNTYSYPPPSSTVSPGVYAAQLHIGSGQTVTLSPGTYDLQAGLLIDNGATVTGNGVMIYNDNGGQISFQGGGQVTLSAATSGPYAGLVIYQNRTSTAAINIANGSTTKITGTVYAPKSDVTFAGGANLSQFGSQFIVNSINVSNNAYVGITWNSSNVVSHQTANLVE